MGEEARRRRPFNSSTLALAEYGIRMSLGLVGRGMVAGPAIIADRLITAGADRLRTRLGMSR